MNVGLASYMDSRIAIHLFQALPDAEKPTIGVKLLTHATESNPFNPALWYRLAEQMPSPTEIHALANTILSHVSNPNLSRIGKDDKPRKGKNKEGPKPNATAVDQREYWETVAKFILNWPGTTRSSASD